MSNDEAPKLPENPATEEENDTTEYDSALKPLLWVLIPFVLLMLYGAFG